MRNKFMPFLSGALASMLIATSCSPKMNSLSDAKILYNHPEAPTENAGPVEVSTTILKHFYQEYGEMADAKWSASANGFMVCFRNNNMLNTIYYRRNGAVEATIHAYEAAQLATPVRRQVQSLFPNYEIGHVDEVQKNGVTAFYVTVQDAATIKKIKLVDGEWEPVESMIKR